MTISFNVSALVRGAIFAVLICLSSSAYAQDSSPSSNQDSSKPSQPPSSQQQTPPAAAPPPQNPNRPGLTAGEQKNVDHEKKTGTSNDRLFFALPNFLSVENADTVPPLTSGEKFKVVARGLYDPSEFILIGAVAGLGQASNSDSAYGQGAQGYAKRYGTAYADNAIENFMASAVLPSVLHQDPRYYVLGSGGFKKRTLHAFSRIVLTRSDSGKQEFNYSEVFGAGIAATISTYSYHPDNERDFSNVITTWGTQIGYDLGTYMLKEFWPDLRKKFGKRSHDATAAAATDGVPTL
jgi:hypothetical protein